MLYAILGVSALISTVVSESYVIFSDTSNPCNNNNEITSIDGSEMSNTLYACIYADGLTSGNYYARFYNPNGDMVYEAVSANVNNYFYYQISLSLSLIAEGDSGDVTYTLKLENSGGSEIVLGDVTVSDLSGPHVEDLAARNTGPSSFEDYYSSGSGSYGDGETIYISSQSDYIYFTSVFESIQNGYTYIISLEGLQSGYIYTRPENSLSSNYDDDVYYHSYYTFSRSMSQFSGDTSIKYTVTLKNNGEVISTKEATILYIIGQEGETTSTTTTIEPTTTTSTSTSEDISTTEEVLSGGVEDVSVRLTAPSFDGDLDEYYSSDPNSFGDGSSLEISSIYSIVYFNVVFNDVYNNYKFDLKIEGVDSQETVSVDSVVIDAVSSDTQKYDYGYSYGTIMSVFKDDTNVRFTAFLYSESDVFVGSKQMEFELVLPESAGYCEPKRYKQSCYTKATENECLNTKGCRWVTP